MIDHHSTHASWLTSTRPASDTMPPSVHITVQSFIRTHSSSEIQLHLQHYKPTVLSWETNSYAAVNKLRAVFCHITLKIKGFGSNLINYLANSNTWMKECINFDWYWYSTCVTVLFNFRGGTYSKRIQFLDYHSCNKSLSSCLVLNLLIRFMHMQCNL